MKLNKKILVLAAVMLTAQSARAAVITRNDEGNIIISGNPGTEYAGTEVQIQILGPFDSNTGFSDAIFGDGGDTSVFMDATYANTVAVGEDGGYSFAYKISEENKFYTAAVLEPGAQTPQTASIYAASDELLNEFITQINQASSAAAINEILGREEYKDLLEGNRSGVSSITDPEALEKVAQGLKDSSPYDNFSDFENELSGLCAVQLTNLSDSAEEARQIAEERLDISTAGLYGYYTSFEDDEKTDVFSRMLGRGFDNLDEYMEVLDESIFLERTAAESYASNMTELITSNEERFDFDLDGYRENSSSVNRKLYGKTFMIMTEFKEALKDAIVDAESGSNGGGGGGNGSSTGGSNSSSSPDSGSIIVDTGNPSKPQIPETVSYFDDLSEVSWAEEAINALAEKKIVAGKEERKFYPNDNVLREEFVQMAVGAFELEAAADGISFEDVSEDAWYYDSICTAFASGIISGKDNNSFGVGENITRQDMAVILYRAAVGRGIEFDIESESFSDDEKISDYAKEAVYALKNKGIVSGVGENRFEPDKNATRAEAARMIYGIMNTEN